MLSMYLTKDLLGHREECLSEESQRQRQTFCEGANRKRIIAKFGVCACACACIFIAVSVCVN